MKIAPILMLLGGVLLIVGFNPPEEDTPRGGGDEVETVSLSPFSKEMGALFSEHSTEDRVALYGKFMALRDWVENTKVGNTSQVDRIYEEVKVGVTVKGLGDLVDKEAEARKLKQPDDLNDVRKEWIAFFEEAALGVRYGLPTRVR